MARALAMPSLSITWNTLKSAFHSTSLSLPIPNPPKFHHQHVRGLRVGNTDIPNEKKLKFALQSIHGIGRKRAQLILAELSIENKPTRELTGLELNSLREEVSKYLTGEDLKRQVKGDIQRLTEIQCYRGYRHLDALPCRGQRTRTNARTRKDNSKPAYQVTPEVRQSRDKRK